MCHGHGARTALVGDVAVIGVAPGRQDYAASCRAVATEMRLIIVRHGESENNVMTDSLTERGLTGDAFQQELLRLHKSDPPLTVLANHLSPQRPSFKYLFL